MTIKAFNPLTDSSFKETKIHPISGFNLQIQELKEKISCCTRVTQLIKMLFAFALSFLACITVIPAIICYVKKISLLDFIKEQWKDPKTSFKVGKVDKNSTFVAITDAAIAEKNLTFFQLDLMATCYYRKKGTNQMAVDVSSGFFASHKIEGLLLEQKVVIDKIQCKAAHLRDFIASNTKGVDLELLSFNQLLTSIGGTEQQTKELATESLSKLIYIKTFDQQELFFKPLESSVVEEIKNKSLSLVITPLLQNWQTTRGPPHHKPTAFPSLPKERRIKRLEEGLNKNTIADRSITLDRTNNRLTIDKYNLYLPKAIDTNETIATRLHRSFIDRKTE